MLFWGDNNLNKNKHLLEFIENLDVTKQVTHTNLMIKLVELHRLSNYKPFINANYLPFEIATENATHTQDVIKLGSPKVSSSKKKEPMINFKKKKIFNITKEKNSLKKIRAVKNNKVVYVNSFTPADIASLKKGVIIFLI